MMNRGVSEASGSPGKITHLVLPTGKRNAGDEEEPVHSKASKQKRVALLLVDAKTLTRECLIQALSASAKDFNVQGVERWKNVDGSLLRHKPDIVLLNINGARIAEQWVAEELQALRDEFPDIPLIVLSERDDTAAAVQAIRLGLRGYVPTTMNCGILVAAVRLVLAGGTFIPSSVVQAEPHAAADKERPGGGGGDEESVTYLGFTRREAQVLEQLQQGKANKLIAYELNISESTVKVHVRNIMKKLNATNRTQVAFLAGRRPT
jgi:DNA-binding NarL/FixJ family response regulator